MALRIQSSDNGVMLLFRTVNVNDTFGKVTEGKEGFIYSGAALTFLNRSILGVFPISI
jgi:hypothetical protein